MNLVKRAPQSLQQDRVYVVLRLQSAMHDIIVNSAVASRTRTTPFSQRSSQSHPLHTYRPPTINPSKAAQIMSSRRVPDKVREVAKEDFEQAKVLAQDAVRSGAYLYPFKVGPICPDSTSHLTKQGILYFFTHRALWRPLAAKLIPALSLGLGVTAFMFAVTYVPQAAVLSIFNGPLAVFTTILLVLSESSTIFNVLNKNFLLDDALIDTFDGTLMSRNMTTLVSNERQVKSGNDPIAKLGKLVSKPFAKFTPSAIIRYFMYLPLNFIPVIGTVLFVILQGRKFGPTAHARYFQLKQMKKQEKEQFIERRKAAYARCVLVTQLSSKHTDNAQLRCSGSPARTRSHCRYPVHFHKHRRCSSLGR